MPVTISFGCKCVLKLKSVAWAWGAAVNGSQARKTLTVATGPQIFVTMKFCVCVAALVLKTKSGHKMFSLFSLSFLLSLPHGQLKKKSFEDILP